MARCTLLGYDWKFHTKAHGWLGFSFRSEEDAEKVLKGQWYWEPTILSLQKWSSFFYPRSKASEKQSIWVKLSIPPIEFYNDKTLREGVLEIAFEE